MRLQILEIYLNKEFVEVIGLSSIKDEFKELFWSNLTITEIKEEIGLTHQEYLELLNELKNELGLPKNYRRNPNRWNKYNQNDYYIIYYFEDDFKIITYAPTLDIAEENLKNFFKNNPEYSEGEFKIELASDRNIKNLIYIEYFIKGNNWEKIISKLKIPYHKFYELLNELKK